MSIQSDTFSCIKTALRKQSDAEEDQCQYCQSASQPKDQAECSASIDCTIAADPIRDVLLRQYRKISRPSSHATLLLKVVGFGLFTTVAALHARILRSGLFHAPSELTVIAR
jgi:hypothetical protein